MASIQSLSVPCRALTAACALFLGSPRLQADEVTACAGLLRVDAADSASNPHTARHTASTRKDWSHFAVTSVQTHETFNMPVYPHYPVAEGAQPIKLATIENDGKTCMVPVDLSGRGVCDLLVGRKDWGGWRVYSNAMGMSKRVDGFIEGYYPKGEETLKTQVLAMDLSDLQVDNNLLIAVGDFLGNGTEQVAYCRPEWTAIQVAGAHGKVPFEADLRGIPVDKDSGDRSHFLFAFKGKPGERTRLAYYRKGVAKLMVFTSDGSRFSRGEAEVQSSWNQLNQCSPNPL